MAVLEILRMGHPLLREKSQPIAPSAITSPEVKVLVNDMIETMRANHGLGLAAPQIGQSVQLAVIEIPEATPRYQVELSSPLIIIFNPKIEILEQDVQGYWEGCLSVPGLRGYVERPQKIKVDFLDENAEEQSLTLEGFMATVFQHELDHLEGLLYIDKLADSRKLAFNEEFDQFFTLID